MPAALDARAPHATHTNDHHTHEHRRTRHDGPPEAPDLTIPDLPPGLDGVAVVAWPGEAARRGLLAAAGEPRILAVAPDAPPPVCWDEQEDWIRLPAAAHDLAARAAGILGRVEPRGAAATGPILDADGLLRSGEDWVALPPVEAKLLARLLDETGAAVARTELLDAGWPDGSADHQNLGGRIKLLRRRIARLGLEIHTVRGVGYLLTVSR